MSVSGRNCMYSRQRVADFLCRWPIFAGIDDDTSVNTVARDQGVFPHEAIRDRGDLYPSDADVFGELDVFSRCVLTDRR